MYLLLSVAGHLMIFITRTRGPWWSIRTARILLAVFATQALATLIAVYGFGIMTPIGWGWAAYVWAYALIWALLTDPAKLLAYRIFRSGRGAGVSGELKRFSAESRGHSLVTVVDAAQWQHAGRSAFFTVCLPRSNCYSFGEFNEAADDPQSLQGVGLVSVRAGGS